MPNRIIPEFWLYDPHLNALKRDAQLFFFRLALAVDDHWRCFVGPSLHEPHYLRSTLYPVNPEVRYTDVSRWLREVQSSGAILVRDSDRGWYVEIPERLRYRKDDYREGQPKFGPRKTVHETPAQAQLPLGPVGLSQPPSLARATTYPHVNPTSTEKLEGSRSRSRKEDEDESAPVQPPGVIALPMPRTEAEYREATRRLEAGEKEKESGKTKTVPGKFAQDETAFPGDEAWGDFLLVLGGKEAVQNGSLWKKRWRAHRSILVRCMLDFRSKPPLERKEINAAAWLTAALENELRRAG